VSEQHVYCNKMSEINYEVDMGIIVLRKQKTQCNYTFRDYYLLLFFISMLINRGFEPRSGQTKDYRIGIRIRIVCRSGATYLPADCCFSELAL